MTVTLFLSCFKQVKQIDFVVICVHCFTVLIKLLKVVSFSCEVMVRILPPPFLLIDRSLLHLDSNMLNQVCRRQISQRMLAHLGGKDFSTS